MPKIEVRRNHNLGLEEAKKRMERIAGEVQRKYGLTGSWVGNRYEFKRTGVKGSVNIQPSQVAVDVDLSIVFSPLKSKVEQAVREKLDQELADKPQGS